VASLTSPVVGQRAALVRAVNDAEARGVRTGVAVCDEDAEVLYRHRAGELFAPASNMKLLTAAAALHGLGQTYKFVTEFAVEAGSLVVKASGDPNWIADTSDDPAKVFGALAAALRQRGVTSLREVRLDHGTFTGPSRPATWPRDQFYAYYCAPTGPFVLQQGTFVVGISASGGRNARAALLAPQAGYAISGSIREVASSKGATYGAVDEGGSIRVRGKFYKKSPRVQIKTSVNSPSRWYRDALMHHLRAGGVSMSDGARPVDLGVVHKHQSALAAALTRILEDSSNFDAEQCMRVLGAESLGDGSLDGGRRAVRAAIGAIVGRVPDGVVVADGSGLSKENRITPGLLVVTMYQLSVKGLAVPLCEHLPVAGKTGTLRKRFLGSDLVGRVRAKTGWIRGASSLSGLVAGPDGRPRWFSILMNYDRGRGGLNKDLKKIQERIVAAVAGMSAG